VCTGSVSHAAAGEIAETHPEPIHWPSVGIEVFVKALAHDIANTLGCSRPMAMHLLFVALHSNPEPKR